MHQMNILILNMWYFSCSVWKPSSPVYAGISGKVLWSAFLFLSVVAGSCTGLSCPYRSCSASENTPGNISSCIRAVLWAHEAAEQKFSQITALGLTVWILPQISFPKTLGQCFLSWLKKKINKNVDCVLLDSGLVSLTVLPCLPVRSCFRGSFWVKFVSSLCQFSDSGTADLADGVVFSISSLLLLFPSLLTLEGGEKNLKT